jgi:hypothetical protein
VAMVPHRCQTGCLQGDLALSFVTVLRGSFSSEPLVSLGSSARRNDLPDVLHPPPRAVQYNMKELHTVLILQRSLFSPKLMCALANPLIFRPPGSYHTYSYSCDHDAKASDERTSARRGDCSI